jgi:hypothetical protein
VNSCIGEPVEVPANHSGLGEGETTATLDSLIVEFVDSVEETEVCSDVVVSPVKIEPVDKGETVDSGLLSCVSSCDLVVVTLALEM